MCLLLLFYGTCIHNLQSKVLNYNNFPVLIIFFPAVRWEISLSSNNACFLITPQNSKLIQIHYRKEEATLIGKSCQPPIALHLPP